VNGEQTKVKDSAKNMTEGSPMRLIFNFSVPLLLGFLMQQFYNIVDMVVVGRFIGANALAGIGVTGSINFLIIGLCVGLCSGFAIPVAQKFGAGDYKMMRRFIANGIWLAIIFAIIITAVTLLLCGTILRMMKTPPEIYDFAYTYIFIIFCGIPTFFLFNLTAGVMRAIGDSKTPMKILIITSILHIILDIVFVIGFANGIAGVAYSTVISQLTSGVLCGILLFKKYPFLRIEKDEFKWQTPLCIALLKMGIPMGLQYSITAIGSVVMQTAINTLGSAAAASISVAVKVSIFFSCALESLGNSMATYGGQNVGAGHLDRLDKGIKASVILASVYSVLAYAVIWFFGEAICSLFVEEADRYILSGAVLFLRISTAFFIPLSLVMIYRFLIQGMGFGTLAMVAGVCEMLARIIAAFVFVPFFGFVGASLSGPLAWLLAIAFLIPAYHFCKKMLKMQKLKTADV